MKEIILQNKKNGMPVLIGNLAFLIMSVVIIICGVIRLDSNPSDVPGTVLLIVGLVFLTFGWIPLLGLRVLKPEEALVLTLFGKYIGTIKGDGFYFVNPFCVSVNPAAKTKLSQSGDVSSSEFPLLKNAGANAVDSQSKKISLYYLVVQHLC